MTIKYDIQKLRPGELVDLFELDCSGIGGSILRFHSGVNELGQDIVWQGNTYSRFPIEVEGFQKTGKGSLPRPMIRVANVTNMVSALILELDDLVGAKLTRHRTFAKYLDRENYNGWIGYGLQTNRTNYATMGSPVSMQIYGGITLEAFVIATDLADAYNFVAGKYNGTDYGGFELYVTSTGAVEFFVRGIGSVDSVQSSGTITPGTSYHIAGTYNDAENTLRVFINGEHTIKSSTISLDGTSAEFRVGKRSDASYEWNGLVDNVRLYNRRVGRTEMQQHMIRNYTDNTNLVGSWSFEQDLLDDTSNNNDGTASIPAPTYRYWVDTNPTADPNIEFPLEVYYIDRKSAENKVFCEFELVSSLDLQGVKIPRRQVIANCCSWIYRSTECGYTGGPVATIMDVLTGDPALDQCSRRLTGCKLRYGTYAELPFGGFPAAGLTR
jgi:phage-related protein